MAKKSKNSELLVHYARTMTPENLSRAANYVGGYVLRGLGALGKIFTAPLTGGPMGTNTVPLYPRTVLLANAERKLRETQEKLIGKAMTWISPLNYGAALMTGNGLNAKKGEEEVASWSPAWLAAARLGELYVGPKAVKGVKSAPRVVVNTAAKAGVKPAKAAVVAREIKLATKNKPKYTRVPSKNLFRTHVYKGGEITDPYSNFVTTDPLYASNYGKIIPYIFESKSVAKAREPMMGSSDPVTMDMFIYNNTKRNPNATAIIGHDAVTGEFTPSKGTEILNMNPKNLYPIRTSDSPTSLAFFERNPSKNNIVGASYDYRMEDPKGSMDFLKQFFALLKINGKEYTLEGLRDAANVQQGLPEHIQSYLNLNTVERAIRAMRKNGYSEREILLYIDKVNEEMNKVKVGMYSDLEYNAAGALDFGGFYNRDTNFISINKDAQLTKPAFTPNYIMKHEGRHLIDYNTSMTDDVINILEKAYDKDFLEIPKHEDAGNLKDYLHMDRERVTTNRDAREVLLSNLEKHPGEFLNLTKFAQTSSGKYKDMVDFLNELILYADPEDIINAVENSNGYGKRYINYLKKNNKLTSTKIEQLRLAMIHVPSYLLPVAGGYTLYNIFNQPLQQLQYLKQGGKMNILEFLKNGGQVRKMQTAAGGPLVNESTRVEKPIIITPKKINKTQLLDDNLWEKTDNSKANVYPNLRNDKYVQEFFLYDYAPRFKRLNNFASKDYVNAALSIYKNTPISIYNKDNNVGGYKTGGEREVYNNYFSNLFNLYRPLSIYLNEKFKLNRPTLVHELTHAFRLGYLGITGDARFSSAKYPIYNRINKEIGNEYYGSGYSNSEKNILNNTYNMNGYKIDYDPLLEKGTTNTEVRFRLWKELYDQLGRRPSLEETDKYIKNYDGEKLLRIIKNANAYGQTMYNNGMLINLIKNALINVAQNNSNNTYLLDDQTYYAKQGGILKFLKNGSGIHIKEKNKGKYFKSINKYVNV